MKVSNVALKARQTLKLRIAYYISIYAMFTVACLPITSAGVNLIRLSMIPPSWLYCIERESVP